MSGGIDDQGRVILPKHLSLAALWTLGVMLVGGAVTAGVTHARIGHIERTISNVQSDHDILVTLKETVRVQTEILKRIDDRMERALQDLRHR